MEDKKYWHALTYRLLYASYLTIVVHLNVSHVNIGLNYEDLQYQCMLLIKCEILVYVFYTGFATRCSSHSNENL